MTHKDSLAQFKDRRVLIMGLGLHGGGVGAAKFFAEAGAKVIVTDLKTAKQLKESMNKLKGLPIKYVLGRHRKIDFLTADLIIKNPGVPNDSPYLKIAQENKMLIDTDVGIFFELCPYPIIGVTGTRGKSTTATLIYELLKTKYSNVYLAGNIRKSVLLELMRISHPKHYRLLSNRQQKQNFLTLKNIPLVILELSSWQLEGLKKHKKSPHIAVVTTIQPDHLNRYKGMAEYIEAKKIIFKYQSKNDYLFLNADDPVVKEFVKQTKSKIIFFNKKQANKYKIKLLGKHNLNNVAAAVSVANHFKIPEHLIKKVLKNFKGLEGRMELITEINGVKYINDTTATTPEATVAAIKAINNHYLLAGDNHLILIAGGADKNLDFTKLAKIIIQHVKLVLLLEGTATNKLIEAIKSYFPTKFSLKPSEISHYPQLNYFSRSYKIVNKGIPLVIAGIKSMHSATKIAYNIAKSGDVVLLSPACASFGLFRHEFDRGKSFKKAVTFLKTKSKIQSVIGK